MTSVKAAGAHLQLVTARRPGLLSAIAGAVRGGIDSVQLRDRGASAGELCVLARDAAAVCSGARKGIFINDRADVARAAGASGAHLGSDGIPIEAARAVLDGWQQVGVSVHSVGEAVAAANGGADYLLFGHVYATVSHPGRPGRGLPALRAVVEAVDIPVLAIGGIDPARVREVMAMGCAGVAAISTLLEQGDPEQAARAMRLALDAGGEPRRLFRAAETRRPGWEKLEP